MEYIEFKQKVLKNECFNKTCYNGVYSLTCIFKFLKSVCLILGVKKMCFIPFLVPVGGSNPWGHSLTLT